MGRAVAPGYPRSTMNTTGQRSSSVRASRGGLPARGAHRSIAAVVATSLVAALLTAVSVAAAAPAAQAAAGDKGTPGAVTTGFPNAIPTAPKPESKVWFAFGSWWASMASMATGGWTIARLDRTAGQWVDTGVALDPRGATSADVLWNGTHLFVASHAVASSSSATSTTEPARLFRYSWNGSAWTPDAGFPVTIAPNSAETMTIAQDGNGKLWATFARYKRPYLVSTSGSADAASVSFGSQYVPSLTNLAAADSTVATTGSSDDISTIVSANGVTTLIWSNQATGQIWAARRTDVGASWTGAPIVTGTLMADDHLSARAIPGDPAKRVVVAFKTSRNDATPAVPSDPLLVAAVYTPSSGTWDTATIATVAESATRPVLAVDSDSIDVYYTAPRVSGTVAFEGDVLAKHSSLSSLSFPATGTVLLRDIGNDTMNNATTSKQLPTVESGILVLAQTETPQRYWFSAIGGTTPSPTPTTTSPTATPTSASPTPTVSAPTASFTATPSTGTAPIDVTFTDTSTGGPTSWTWDFGDGTTGSGSSVTHRYATPGSFTVTLTASNAGGSTTATAVIGVAPSPSPTPTSPSPTPTVTPVGTVIDRVNAGGVAVTGGWTVDTVANPSPWSNSAATKNKVTTTTSAIDMSSATIPSGTPSTLFQTGRYDVSGGKDMIWTLPVPSAGTYKVRLYFAETYWTAAGKRTFDVTINGTKVLTGFDIFAAAGGAKKGIVREYTVSTSGPISITFGRGLDNPMVNAIEVLTP